MSRNDELSEKEKQQEADIQTVLALLREGKQMNAENRANLEYHQFGYDRERGDYYHRVEVAAAGEKPRLSYGENSVRYWVAHWIRVLTLEGLKKEQGWD